MGGMCYLTEHSLCRDDALVDLSSDANAHSVQLSSKRRVNVTKFNNALLINIREYYEADGELKPGKKVRQLLSPLAEPTFVRHTTNIAETWNFAFGRSIQ